MPDPVSCNPPSDGSHVIECDPVVIGPEPETAETEDVRPGEEPGVRALVASQTPPYRVRGRVSVHVDVPVPVGEILRDCSTKLLGAVTALGSAERQHPALASLNAMKAGLEIGQCVADTIARVTTEAQEQRAVEACEEHGGTPLGFVLGELTCEVSPENPLSDEELR
jgi:hypothetical protein